ncbi:hypothetical protein NIES2101_29890 [Calothrix sp. HK-06]|nr:hypothetical protein NIES2101_29890 [Calothrix sp. HK-06]
MSELSPYEENILDFVNLAKTQNNLLTEDDWVSLRELIATLPDDIEIISDELALWYDNRPHILNAILELPIEESANNRGPQGRKTRLNPKEVKEMIDNIVRQSIPSSNPPAPYSQKHDTNSENTQS